MNSTISQTAAHPSVRAGELPNQEAHVSCHRGKLPNKQLYLPTMLKTEIIAHDKTKKNTRQKYHTFTPLFSSIL